MGDKEKSEIQKVVDLLEENCYHVIAAAEEIVNPGTICNFRVISLKITPMKEEKENR
ncbi:MAG: hypothetical protein LBK83_07815 [Treponema sp.]|jgi:hypothetical protein|nr:hypothetical protein [Treponema sp.]